MAFEADSVIVSLIADISKFDTPVKTSAQSFDASMNKIVASATKAESAVTKSSNARTSAIQRESAQISQFASMLSRDMDFAGAHISGPKSPFVVVPNEAPKVSNALKLVQVGGVAMSAVLGGAVVTASIAAVEALAQLIAKGQGADAEIRGMVESLKEHAEKTQRAEQAQEIFGRTLEGVTQAIRDDQRALEALNNEQKTSARVALENAEKRMIVLQGLRDETAAALDAARAYIELEKAKLDRSPGRGFEAAVAGLQATSKNIDALEQKLGKVDDLIKSQRGRIDEALSFNAVEIGQQLSNPIERINAKYNGLIKAARERAVAEGTVRTTLVKQTEELEKQRKAEVDAARKRATSDRSNQQSGRQITVAQAKAIVEGIGGTVTSGFRSVQHNEDVGGVKGSFHTKGQAVDIAKTAGLTLGKIVKAFEEQGVRLIEKLDEGNHFHIAFAKRSGPRGPSEETLARRAEQQAKQEANREQAFQNEKANLESQVIDGRQALITSVEEIAKLELQAVDIAHDKYADDVANQVQTKKLHEDEAAELLKLNDERAELRKEAVKRRLAEQQARIREADLRRAAEVAGADLQAQQDLLQSQEQLATTARERHDIERRIIDLQFAEERLRLENQIAIARQVQANKDGAFSAEQIKDAIAAEAEARSQLSTLPARQSNAQAGNDQQNASPLQDYFNQIPETAAEIDEAFEQIAANGLATFTDALTDAIVNFRSLGDVGRAVLLGLTTDLVKLAIRMVLNATIGKLVSKIATAGAATEATSLAVAWAPAAAAASLATLGANAGPAIAAISAANAAALGFAAASGAGAAGGFAEGGRIRGPGSSTSDSVPLWGSNDEFMIKAQSARRLGYSNLEEMNRTGELPRYVTDADVPRSIRPSNAVAARPGGSSAGGISEDALRRIEGAVERGAAAQSPVNLYPTMSPKDAAQAMLSDPAAQRVFFEFFGQNSTRIQASQR